MTTNINLRDSINNLENLHIEASNEQCPTRFEGLRASFHTTLESLTKNTSLLNATVVKQVREINQQFQQMVAKRAVEKPIATTTNLTVTTQTSSDEDMENSFVNVPSQKDLKISKKPSFLFGITKTLSLNSEEKKLDKYVEKLKRLVQEAYLSHRGRSLETIGEEFDDIITDIQLLDGDRIRMALGLKTEETISDLSEAITILISNQ